MDAFLKQVERLAHMAEARSVPRPLDSVGVMMRIRGLELEDDRVLSLPLGFFAGGAAAAAAAAAAVSLFALSAWQDMASPILAMEALFDVAEFI